MASKEKRTEENLMKIRLKKFISKGKERWVIIENRKEVLEEEVYEEEIFEEVKLEEEKFEEEEENAMKKNEISIIEDKKIEDKVIVKLRKDVETVFYWKEKK